MLCDTASRRGQSVATGFAGRDTWAKSLQPAARTDTWSHTAVFCELLLHCTVATPLHRCYSTAPLLLRCTVATPLQPPPAGTASAQVPKTNFKSRAVSEDASEATDSPQRPKSAMRADKTPSTEKTPKAGKGGKGSKAAHRVRRSLAVC